MKRILFLAALVVMAFAGCDSPDRTKTVLIYQTLLQQVKEGKMPARDEFRAMTDLKMAIMSGKVTLEELGTSRIEIKLLDAKAIIRFREDCVQMMSTLNPKSEEYQALLWIINDIDKGGK